MQKSPDGIALLKTHIEGILEALDRFPETEIFHFPVPVSAPDYYDIIENPVDLSMVRQRLKDGYYSCVIIFCCSKC